MKSFIFVVLVAGQLFVDAKTLPSRTHRVVDATCSAKMVTVGQQDESILATYTPNTCNDGSVDTIKYKIDGGAEYIEVNHVPGLPGLVLISGLELSCIQIKVVVTTTGLDADGGAVTLEDFMEFNIRIPAVEDLTVKLEGDQVVVKWEPQPFASACSLTYKVQYGPAGDKSCQTHENCAVDINEFKMCKATEITVTAVTGTVESESAEATFTRPIMTVDSFDVETDATTNAIKTTFTPLDLTANDFSECRTVSYAVSQTNGKCFHGEFSVLVVPETGKPSSSASKSHNKGPGKVLNFDHTTNGDQIHLTWDPPNDSEDCENIWYIVTNEIGASIASTHLTSVQVLNPAKACETKPISIKASNGKEGAVTTRDVDGHFGGVKDLTCSYDGTNINCKWLIPDNTVGCDLEYDITYFDGQSSSEKTDRVTTESFPITSSACTQAYIKVTPVTVLNNRKGLEMQKMLNDADCVVVPYTWKNFARSVHNKLFV